MHRRETRMPAPNVHINSVKLCKERNRPLRDRVELKEGQTEDG